MPLLDGLEPVVIPDPGGKRTGTWRTHRACLESMPPDASHLMVLQDDALPCLNFPETVGSALSAFPARVILLFTPGYGWLTRGFALARHQGKASFEFPVRSFVPLVAIIYPREHVEAIPAFTDQRRTPATRADDGIVATYARANRVQPVSTVPSLVQHRDELPSVMKMPHGRGSPHRLAAWWEPDAGSLWKQRAGVVDSAQPREP